MKLAIVIPVKNDLRILERVAQVTKYFNSLSGREYFSEFEITVVDDIINKTVENHLREWSVNYIAGETNGKGDAVFRALKTIDAEHYIIIDSDESISVESIDRLCTVIEASRTVDLIYGVRVFKNVSKFRRLLGLIQLFFANIFVLSSFVQDTHSNQML